MDDKNQNASPQQSPSQPQVEPQVIKPTNPQTDVKSQTTTPAPVTNSPTPEPSKPVSEPTASTQPTVQPQTGTVTPGVVTGGEAPTGKPFVPISNSSGHNSKTRLIKLIGLVVAAVVFVVLASLIATNYNLRATIFGTKFRQYTLINNRGEEYKTLFYKGSHIQNYSFGAVTDNVLVSPPIDKVGVQLVLSLAGRSGNSNAAAQKDVDSSNNCPSTKTIEDVEAFSVAIKSVGANANFCTNQTKSGIGPVEFVSFFGNKSSVYLINIGPYHSTSTVSASFITALKATHLSDSDMKTIAASFKYIATE